MNPADTRPGPAVLTIPLGKLEVSPGNVRKTDAGQQAFAELKASIAEIGVLSNLVVRPVPDSDERYAVVAGSRRYAALVQLAHEGQVATDMPVPCRIVPRDASETEISLAENVVRAAMHPADQVEAFATMADAGATASSIAARFGVAERTVEQRLRLGNAAPELLQAYREDEIDLACLKAFAITTDHARQTAAWSQVREQGYRPGAWQIKRMLTESRVPANAAVAAFVGLDAYEAAGGAVDRDLFADEHDSDVWFEDPQLLDKLAMERLQTVADDLAKTWKWAEPRLQTEWSDTASYGRVHPVPSQPTTEETAEAERLQTRQEELCNIDGEALTDKLYAESERNEERLAEIEAEIESRAQFSDDDKAIAGCIVTIDHDGDLHIVGGLVRPDDIPSHTATPATASGHREHDNAAQGHTIDPPRRTAVERPSDREAQARKEAGIGIGVADDLRAIRTTIVKAHLAKNFEPAFDLFVFQMARSVFTTGYRPSALEITARETADRPQLRMNDESFAAENPGEAMLLEAADISVHWMEIEDDNDSFAAFRAMTVEEKQTIFSACVARTVKGQLAFEPSARPELEATIARLDIDFAAHLRPSSDIFWSRVTKATMLDIAGATIGTDWAANHRKEKKAVLAATMERAFGAGDDVPPGIGPDARAAALAWLPPGFAPFDTAAIDTTANADAPGQTEPAPAPQPVQAPPSEAGTVSAHEPPAEDPDADRPDPAPSGPRVIIAEIPPEHATEAGQPLHADAAAAVPPANGHDPAASGEAFDIPEFLRRT